MPGKLTPQFQAALNNFVAGAKALIEDHYRANYRGLPVPVIEVEAMRRYVRIWKTGNQQKTVYCFVQIDNGDVLKAESWRKPAMHKRSSIYDADFGMSGVTWHGGKYL